MYCEKLEAILNHKNSPLHNIFDNEVKKFDLFIKDHTTNFERGNLSPVKFSLTMNVDHNTSLMFYNIGVKVSLFSPVIFYKCECGSQHKIFSIDEEIECDCGKLVLPEKDPHNVHVYFKLMEPPEDCSFFDDRDQSKTQIEALDNDLLGKSSTMSDYKKVLGPNETTYMLTSSRNKQFEDYIRDKTK
ncbi:hypothetical protein [Salibacterium lacus]|uniref:DUF177 domain-containing protein n=1 Tax=Salibacterium lacus TaxID=1898109 RepID=A0ABW5SWU7_9BACI